MIAAVELTQWRMELDARFTSLLHQIFRVEP